MEVRRRRGFVVIALACFVAVQTLAQQKAKEPARAEPTMSAPKGDVLEWTDARGKPLWYLLPKGLAPGKPVHLLIMLHGTGMKWGWAFWNYPIANGAFRKSDIVVAPEGMTDGQGGTFNFVQGKADGDHIAELIGDFKKRFPIDRVYLYGHSQGAFFAYWFAGEHPELVDGFVAHAGNVLGNVKHSQIAKEKIAVGILHGRADAVVPVECAISTEKVYRDLGYKKLKLQIVEGLNEQTGHWPLPKQVGEMIDWLDSVSTDSPLETLRSVCSVLAHEEPDLSVVVEGLARTEKLLKSSTKVPDRDVLSAQLATLSTWLSGVAGAHAKAIAERADSRKSDAGLTAPLVQFRVVNRSLEGFAPWNDAMKDLRSRAAQHERAIGPAVDKFARNGLKDASDLAKGIDGAFLARRYDDLLSQIERALAAPPPGVKPEGLAKLRALVESRRNVEQEGREAARRITAAQTEALRQAHPELFTKD